MLLIRYTDNIDAALSTGGKAAGDYTWEELYTLGYEIDTALEEEGAVLLKNQGGILPLNSGEKVTLLGYSSYAYIIGGAGAGKGCDDEYTVSMYDAFKTAGLDVNEAGWAALEKVTAKAVHQVDASNHERKIAYYEKMFTEEVIGEYDEVAIVTIGRNGGEGITLTETYLQLNEADIALLRFAAEHFKSTIVLINSSNAMELGFIDDPQYNIKACLWIGGPGESGVVGVGNILAGLISPSGKTVDTWAYTIRSAPSFYNTGDNRYTNYSDCGYYQYEEGIYVGYKWYETADAEGYFDTDACRQLLGVTGYDNVVQFPFGYGMSYTTFSQKITDSRIDLSPHATDNYVEVEVTNTGTTYSGKDVVQIYMTAPYGTDPTCGINDAGDIVPLEKAAKQLVAFAKTEKALAPGESEKVKVYFDTDDLAAYDVFGHNCYVLEKGDYTFSAGVDAHNIYDSVTAGLADTIVYNSAGAGARDSDIKVAENVLNDVTAGDGAYSGDLKNAYLSRADFVGGMAKITAHGPDARDEALSEDMLRAVTTPALKSEEVSVTAYRNGAQTTESVTFYFSGARAESYENVNWYGKSVSDPEYKVTTGDAAWISENGVTIDAMKGAEIEDERWEHLLDALTVEELVTYQYNQGQSPELASIGKPMARYSDGPAEIGNGALEGATWFSTAVVIASTWNEELAERTGEIYGLQSVYYNILGAYSPGMNIHRSPLGGRNFEYYSEDGFIAGKIGARMIKGIQSTGTMVFMKHCILNDNETNRHGGLTFCSEQALREIYAIPFEYSVKEGGSLGIMASLNRIGVSWAHPGFYRSILRDEWGFEGLVISDAATGTSGSFMSSNVALYGGINAMLSGTSLLEFSETDGKGGATASDYGMYLLRETARFGLNQYAHAMSGSVMLEKNESWHTAWTVLNVALALGMAASAVFLIVLPAVKLTKLSRRASAKSGKGAAK